MNKKVLSIAVAIGCSGLAFGMSPADRFRAYVREFRADDREFVTNAVSNADAEEFLVSNVPYFACPDADVERTFAFRWWSLRKHFFKSLGGWCVSEFTDTRAISCPVGHHLFEGRWVRDRAIYDDYTRYWFKKGANPIHGPGSYINWIVQGVLARERVTGDRALADSLLDGFVANYEAWERGWEARPWPAEGMYKMGLKDDGLFHDVDDREGTELTLSGNGARPHVNAMMYGEAKAIAKIAARNGRADLAAAFEARAARLERLMKQILWNEEKSFFCLRKDDGTLSDVCELHGYSAWYAGLPLDEERYAAAWKYFADTKIGFAAPKGLTFPVQSAKGFRISYEGHACQWNGPSWPYATSVALTALNRSLRAGMRLPVGRKEWLAAFLTYTHQHCQKTPEGKVRPWLDEVYDPYSGDWIAYRRWQREDCRNYNHSTYCDLLITGLVGLQIADDGTCTADPNVPEDWTWFRLENVPVRNRLVTVVYDRDGTRFGGKKGISIYEKCAAAAVPARQEADFPTLALKGFAGERLAACERNLVAAKDADDLAFPFTQKTESGSWGVLEPGIWQTEFWGKWMHAAVPMCARSGDAAFRARIAKSVKTLLDSQLPDGYIGNYRETNRGDVCDVWGCKYVMMGLLHWYDSTGDEAALKGTCRVADWLMSKFGPGKRSLGAEGPFNGLMNCSVLEPVVWTYRRSGDRKYLDFAKWIVSELDTNPKGPEIFAFAAKRTPLKDCKAKDSGNKAYEKMSCCQGLLDYYLETGDARCLATAKTIAEQAIEEEIDLTGGGTQYERFCGFRKMQTRDRWIASEMCVIITWMRLCEKLLTITGEAKWADELERSFYNAYLAGLAADGASFASYGGLGGTREHRHPRQCRMEENCCNANGPRGFVAFCSSIAQSKDDEIWLSQYVLGRCSVPCKAAKGGKVVLDQYNLYPRKLESSLTLALEAPATFALHLRAPAWSTNTLVRVSDGETRSATSGGWITFRRTWKPGDQVKVTFDAAVKTHEQDGYVAFTRGPVVLARDSRFADGDHSEPVAVEKDVPTPFFETMPPDAAMYLGITAFFKTGSHDDPPRPIRFCDFASAGNTEDCKSFYRVWLPLRQ